MGVGAQNQPLLPQRGCPPAGGPAREPRVRIVFSALGNREERCGTGCSLSPSSLLLPSQMPPGAWLLESSRAPCPAGAASEPEGSAWPSGGRGPRGAGTEPACCELAPLGCGAEAWAPRRGRVKNNSIKTSKTFGFTFGGGRCFKKKKIREEPQNPKAKPNPNPSC